MSEQLSIYEGYVLQENLEWLSKKVVGLNRRAKRLHLPAMELRVHRDDVKTEKNDGGLVAVFIRCELLGETPLIAGWHLVARVEHNNDPAFKGGNVIAVVPGQVLPEAYRTADPVCDHCKTSRYRNDTFIVKNEEGEYKQVGRSCLRDFMGHVSAAALIEWSKYERFAADMWTEAHDFMGRVRYAYHLPTFMAMVVACVETNGWVSCAAARESEGELTSTRSEVLHQLGNNRIPDYLRIRPTEHHEKVAEECIEWAKQLGDRSDYDYNLGNVARSGVCPESLTGLTASMYISYKKAMDLLEKKAARKPSEWVGEKGQKLELKVRYANCWYYDNGFGTTSILKFYDENDNIIIWKTGSMTEENFVKDAWYILKGSVKDHDDFHEEKQTKMTRCKITPVEEGK